MRGLFLSTVPFMLDAQATLAALGARMSSSLISGDAVDEREVALKPWLDSPLLACGLEDYKLSEEPPKVRMYFSVVCSAVIVDVWLAHDTSQETPPHTHTPKVCYSLERHLHFVVPHVCTVVS